MVATKIKVVYTLFLISFSIWLAVVLLVLSPAVATGNQIQFPSPTLQTLFIGSAATSVIACIIIGLDYLGLKMTSRNRTRTLKKTETPSIISPNKTGNDS
jgi:uncharacterized membrane protein YciS (DUF1049 family)